MQTKEEVGTKGEAPETGSEENQASVPLSGSRPINLQEEMNRVEKKIIEHYISENRYLKDAADKLGISPQALQYKIKKLKVKL